MEKCPEAVAVGDAVLSVVDVALLTIAWPALSWSRSLAADVSKFVPVTVTAVPATPLAGLKLVIVGTPLPVVTVKLAALVAVPLGLVTEIAPLVAPVGTVARICVVLAEVMVAVVPWNLTVSWLAVALKAVP